MERPELRPAIVQDAETNRVLMLAWMDDEALRRTRESGEAWFWSRSRQEHWHKGATSGNTMAVEVPVIASGGAGEARHLAEAFEVGAEAALIASIVHERPERLPELKAELREAGWNVRS